MLFPLNANNGKTFMPTFYSFYLLLCKTENVKVCNCYDVTKAQLIRAIQKYSIDTITDLQNATKASTGCGRCKSVVKDILNQEMEKQRQRVQQLRLPF